MTNLDYIKKHLSYTSTNEIKEICAPLFKACRLNYFDYARTYKDFQFLYFTTDHDWLYHFLKSKYPVSETIIDHSGIFLYNHLPNKSCIDFQERNYHNGIAVFRKTKNFLETFMVATSDKDYSVINFYLNHKDLFDQFLLYFKDKASKLINQEEKNRLIIPKENRGIILKKNTFEEFYDLTKTNNIHMHAQNKDVILSRIEYETLKQLATGKTMKEIARTLSLSPRTIESHINNAKHKTNCPVKGQLIDLFYDNFWID